ncbi:Ig-like domain-containing protein [Methanobrevibacter sp.]
MKINKLLVISIFLISMLAIGAVSASNNDDITNITATSDINDIQNIDNENTDEVIASSNNEEIETINADLNQNDDEILTESSVNDEIEMNISANETPYDEDAVIEVNVKNKTATTNFNNSIVNVYVDGVFLKNITLDKDGKASFNIPAGTYDVGNYHIQAYFDNNVQIAKDTILNIIKATPIVNVNNVTSKAGEIVTIPFNVTNSKGKGISGDVIITIYWQEDSISKYVKITDGTAKASFNLSDLIGIFGNGTNGTFDFSSLFNGTNTTFDISSLFNGTNGTFDMSSLFGENSTFDISSFLNGTSNITVGNNSFNLTGLKNGTFSIGNSSFDIGSLLNGTTKISFGNTTIDFSTLFGQKDNNTNSGDVLGAAENDNLKANSTFDLSSLFNGNSTFKIGNSTFDLSSLLNGTFTIGNSSFDIGSLLNGTTNMTLGNTTFDFGSLFNGTNTTFDISGLLDMLLGKGDNTFAYLFTPGTYKIAVTYLSSRNYNAYTNDTASLIITPSNVTFPLTTDLICNGMTVTAVNTAIDGKIGKYLTITLKDVLGDAVVNKTVKIGFDGKEYEVITDDNGVAKLQINIAKAGVYTASVCFLGDNIYTGSFKVVKITVNKQTPKLTVAKKTYKAKSKKKILKATFKTAKGKAIKGKKITFKVKGKTYTAKTNKKGVASVKVKITKKGKHTFTAKFAGDNTYKAVTKKSKLTIK